LAYLASHPRTHITLKDLSQRLRIRSKAEYADLRSSLEELEREGRVQTDTQGRIGYAKAPPERTNRMQGTLQVTRRGDGFVTVEGLAADIYIASRFLHTSMDGDMVEVVLFAKSARTRRRVEDQRREGEVVRVLQRARTQLSGRLEVRQRFAFVIPDDERISRDIYLDADEARKAQPGDKVVVEMLPWEDEHLNPEGKIIEVLGPAGDVRVEVLSVARRFSLSAAFPADVEQEAAVIAETIPPAEVRQRLDLRKTACITIDPEDAKDFDDALSIEVLRGGGWRLGVHIADVSHYVREGTSLDAEALARGTSVYMVNETIPMLPARLSTNLCSLRPQEDRLAFSVLMDVDAEGKVEKYRFAKSIIRSCRRFTYEEAQAVIDAGKGERHETLLPLQDLATILLRRRRKAGSIDFETPEAKFTFDAQGFPTAIVKKTRLDAHRLVEECMLLANRTVAEHVFRLGTQGDAYPFLYRVHDQPDPQRMAELADFVKPCGFSLDAKNGVPPRELQKLLSKVKGTEFENLINQVALRAMAKAIYSDKNIGHYGLAFRTYTHFTSPIRRYPDLVVHRLLHEYGSVVKAAHREELRKQLPAIAEHSSERERNAMQAERTSVRVMQMEYMKRHVGDEFTGVIGGVTDFGLFVEIDDLLVQGLVRVRDLTDDYYLFDDKRYSLKGRSRGRTYRLGDTVRVQVAAVNAENHELDLTIVESGTRNF
jgi:ribonuclease R